MACFNKGDVVINDNGFSIQLTLFDETFILNNGIPNQFVQQSGGDGSIRLRQVREKTVPGYGRDFRQALSQYTSRSETVWRQAEAIARMKNDVNDKTFHFKADKTC